VSRGYCDLLGLTKLMEESHPDGAGYAVVLGRLTGRCALGSTRTKPTNASDSRSRGPDSTTSASWCPVARSLDAWESKLTELEVEHSPVNDQGGYAVLVFRDPDNIQLEFFSMG